MVNQTLAELLAEPDCGDGDTILYQVAGEQCEGIVSRDAQGDWFVTPVKKLLGGAWYDVHETKMTHFNEIKVLKVLKSESEESTMEKQKVKV